MINAAGGLIAASDAYFALHAAQLAALLLIIGNGRCKRHGTWHPDMSEGGNDYLSHMAYDAALKKQGQP